MTERLRAIRGATTIEADTEEQVRLRTQELIGEMFRRNEVENDDLVSIMFTATSDISSAFPATAARQLGLSEVPLMGACELDVKGALPRCIRVLVHCYSKRSREQIRHVYLEGATALRSDLVE